MSKDLMNNDHNLFVLTFRLILLPSKIFLDFNVTNFGSCEVKEFSMNSKEAKFN